MANNPLQRLQQKYRISWSQQTGMAPAINKALGTQLANVDECLETLFGELRRLTAEVLTLTAQLAAVQTATGTGHCCVAAPIALDGFDGLEEAPSPFGTIVSPTPAPTVAAAQLAMILIEDGGDGTDGPPGQRGADGAPGATGPAGPTGPSGGVRGTDGMPGMDADEPQLGDILQLIRNDIVYPPGVTVDAGVNFVSAGIKGYRRITQDGTVKRWTVMGHSAGSIRFDIKKGSSFPPTVSIVGSNYPELVSTNIASDSPTGWTTSVKAGEYLEFSVLGSPTVSKATLELEIGQ